MIGIRKIMYYPLWKFDELESVLEQMERSGLRLDYICFSYIFYFSNSTPKDTSYIITYSMAKDNTPGMHEYNFKLLSEYSANEIKARFTGYHTYRITQNYRDFNELKKYRALYIKQVLLRYLIISIFCFLIGLYPTIGSIILMKRTFTSIFIYLYTVLSFFTTIYHAYGYTKQRRSCKKI